MIFLFRKLTRLVKDKNLIDIFPEEMKNGCFLSDRSLILQKPSYEVNISDLMFDIFYITVS